MINFCLINGTFFVDVASSISLVKVLPAKNWCVSGMIRCRGQDCEKMKKYLLWVENALSCYNSIKKDSLCATYFKWEGNFTYIYK